MTVWRIVIQPTAKKQLQKFGHLDRDRIVRFIREKLATSDHPRRFGHPLAGEFAGLWTYRVGDLRIIASIQDDRLTIAVVRVGNRREVYR